MELNHHYSPKTTWTRHGFVGAYPAYTSIPNKKEKNIKYKNILNRTSFWSVPCSCCLGRIKKNSRKSYNVLWVLTWVGRIWIFNNKIQIVKFINILPTPEHGIGGRQIPFYFISNLMNKGSWIVVVLGGYITPLFKTNQVFLTKNFLSESHFCTITLYLVRL
jgi:hypothetical protein